MSSLSPSSLRWPHSPRLSGQETSLRRCPGRRTLHLREEGGRDDGKEGERDRREGETEEERERDSQKGKEE